MAPHKYLNNIVSFTIRALFYVTFPNSRESCGATQKTSKQKAFQPKVQFSITVTFSLFPKIALLLKLLIEAEQFDFFY